MIRWFALSTWMTLAGCGMPDAIPPPTPGPEPAQDVSYDTPMGTLRGWRCVSASARQTFVLLHDMSYDRRLWGAGPQRLCSGGYTVLALDLLGAGQSAHPPGDTVTLEAQADALTQALAGETLPLFLVGQGQGAATALLLSHRRRVEGLVLVAFSPADYIFPVLPVAMEPYLAQGDYIDMRLPNPAVKDPPLPSVRGWLLYHPAGADPGRAAADDAELAQPHPRASMREMLTLSGDPALLELGRVTPRVLEILGEQDKWFPALRGMGDAALYPAATAARVEALANTGHSIPLHQSAPQLWDRVLSWARE